jgi:hypothetical protein
MPNTTSPVPSPPQEPPGAHRAALLPLRKRVASVTGASRRELARTAVLGIVKGAAVAAGSTPFSFILWWTQHH